MKHILFHRDSKGAITLTGCRPLPPNKLKKMNTSSNQLGDSFTQEVWASNLEIEMKKIRDIIELFPYVAMVKRTNQSLNILSSISSSISSNIIIYKSWKSDDLLSRKTSNLNDNSAKRLLGYRIPWCRGSAHWKL